MRVLELKKEGIDMEVAQSGKGRRQVTLDAFLTPREEKRSQKREFPLKIERKAKVGLRRTGAGIKEERSFVEVESLTDEEEQKENKYDPNHSDHHHLPLVPTPSLPKPTQLQLNHQHIIKIKQETKEQEEQMVSESEDEDDDPSSLFSLTRPQLTSESTEEKKGTIKTIISYPLSPTPGVGTTVEFQVKKEAGPISVSSASRILTPLPKLHPNLSPAPPSLKKEAICQEPNRTASENTEMLPEDLMESKYYADTIEQQPPSESEYKQTLSNHSASGNSFHLSRAAPFDFPVQNSLSHYSISPLATHSFSATAATSYQTFARPDQKSFEISSNQHRPSLPPPPIQSDSDPTAASTYTTYRFKKRSEIEAERTAERQQDDDPSGTYVPSPRLHYEPAIERSSSSSTGSNVGRKRSRSISSRPAASFKAKKTKKSKPTAQSRKKKKVEKKEDLSEIDAKNNEGEKGAATPSISASDAGRWLTIAGRRYYILPNGARLTGSRAYKAYEKFKKRNGNGKKEGKSKKRARKKKSIVVKKKKTMAKRKRTKTQENSSEEEQEPSSRSESEEGETEWLPPSERKEETPEMENIFKAENPGYPTTTEIPNNKKRGQSGRATKAKMENISDPVVSVPSLQAAQHSAVRGQIRPSRLISRSPPLGFTSAAPPAARGLSLAEMEADDIEDDDDFD